MAAKVETLPQWFPLIPSSPSQQKAEHLVAAPPWRVGATPPLQPLASVRRRELWDRHEHLAGRCHLGQENMYPGVNPNQKAAIIYITNGKGSMTLPEVDEYEIKDFEWSSETVHYYSKYKDRRITDWKGKWPKISDFANNTWDMLLRDEAEYHRCGASSFLLRTPTSLEAQRYSAPSTPPVNLKIRQAP